MGKREVLRYALIGMITLTLVSILMVLRGGMTGYAVYGDSSGSDFNEGSYVNTEWNGSAVVLSSNNLSGSYTSQIFNAGAEAVWNNLSWISNDIGELPNNGEGSLMDENVLLMHLNEDSGVIEDSSGQGNNGTYNGVLYSQSGKLNTAIGFDGVDDYVNLGNKLNFERNDSFSIESWIKTSSSGVGDVIISKILTVSPFRGWVIDTDGGAIRLILSSTYPGNDLIVKTSNTFNDNTWHNVVVTYTGNSAPSGVNIYVDGVNQSFSIVDNSLSATISNSADCSVGSRGGSVLFWSGSLDEVAILNRSLSSDEVSEIYNRGILKLNLSARSCNDDACSAETWADITDTSPQDLSLDNNPYFQYKFLFNTDDSSYSPELYDISVDYSLLNTAPTISIVLPQEGATYGYNESLALNFSVFDNDGNIGSCWYNLDGGANVSLAGCLNTTFDVSVDGEYILNIYVNDTLGESDSDSKTFTIQLGAPTIVLHSPIDEYLNYQEDIYFNYTPSDLDLDYCELWGNFSGAWRLNQTDNSPLSGAVNSFVLTLPNNNYTWNVRCVDDEGNDAFNGDKTFVVDSVNPGLVISEPMGEKNSRIDIPLTFSASDLNLGTCKYNVYRGASLEIANTTVDCGGSGTFDVTVDADFVLNLYVEDLAENVNSMNISFSVSTDTIGPPIVVVDGGSSSGGGGGSYVPSKVGSVEVSDIKNIIAHKGDKKTISLDVKNNGKVFLNTCKLSIVGEISSWIYSEGIMGIAPGENTEFIFNINIPEEIETGDYKGELELKCDEVVHNQSLTISIPERGGLIRIDEITHQEDGLNISYTLDNSNLIGENIAIEIWILDEEQNEIERVTDDFGINVGSPITRNIMVELPKKSIGIYSVYLSIIDDVDSIVKQSVVLGKPSTTGMAIFDTARGKTLSYVMFVLVIGIGIFFMLRGRGKKGKGRGKRGKGGGDKNHWLMMDKK